MYTFLAYYGFQYSDLVWFGFGSIASLKVIVEVAATN